jgi:heat shock transcription factor, other eukaryote
MSSRKRRAPGASPQIQQQQQSALQPNVYPPAQEATNMSTDQYLNWDDAAIMNNVPSAYSDPSLYDSNMYTTNTNGSIPQVSGANLPTDSATYSGQLVKRNTNQQLAARGRSPWETFNGDSGGGQQAGGWENTDDDEELEQKAMLARKDAQSKRKQIPPFVQKLSR